MPKVQRTPVEQVRAIEAACRRRLAWQRHLERERLAARRVQIALYAQRHGDKAAAEIAGVRTDTVWRWRRRVLGLSAEARKRQRFERKAEILVTAFLENDSAAARLHGVSRMAIWHWKKEYNASPELRAAVDEAQVRLSEQAKGY